MISQQFWLWVQITPTILGVISILNAQNASATSPPIEGGYLKPNSTAIEAAITPTTSQVVSADEALSVLRQHPQPQSFYPLPKTDDKLAGAMSQITSVSELRDVAPSDWAYEALRSLVERYGCIAGYPDRTFRGNRTLSRWEFAAGLNACLNNIERLLQENAAILTEDLDKLKRLAEAFKSELTALGARIDNLEIRAAFLEDHQFSTTTKMTGEVIFGMSGIVGGQKNAGTEKIPQVTIFGYRARLELNTSFTGEDLLYTRLATGNISEYTEVAGTLQGNLFFAQPGDSKLAVEVVNYNFPISENIAMWVEGAGGAFDDFTNTLNILDGDGASGALSVFGTRAPIYYQGEGAGVGFQGQWGALEWSLGYLAPFAENPNPGNGLFNGAFGFLAQVGYFPDENFGVAFTYNHGYNTFATGTGSRRRANIREFLQNLGNISHNSYNLGFSWQIADNFVLGGWGGLTEAKLLNAVETADLGTIARGQADIWNWAVTLAFPDAFKEGSIAGIIVGMSPWVTSSNIVIPGTPSTTDEGSVHIEAFYQYAVSDNISLTPGIIIATAPDNDSRNSPLIIGVIRTTFEF